MKKILLFFGICIFAASCSNEENAITPEEQVSFQEGHAKRLAIDVYPDFADLLKKLYDDEYAVGINKSYSDDFDTYTLNEVFHEKDGSGGIAGYFIRMSTSGDVVYIDIIENSDTVDSYELEPGDGFVKATYDLTEDPVYFDNGFTPDWQTKEPKPRRRLFGWGSYDIPGDCTENSPATIPKSCSRTISRRFHVLWLGFKKEPAMNNGEPITEPCDCPA